MGVWIETTNIKQEGKATHVTPCMGVWIETENPFRHQVFVPSHPVWVCGLKHRPAHHRGNPVRSHPVWVCGLKHGGDGRRPGAEESHPVWVCGLKLNIEQMEDEAIKVTPCMGVWIETASMLHILWNGVSHPIWVCGLKHPR